MNHYDDPMIERAVKALLRRAASLGFSLQLPSAGSSERKGNIVTLANINGRMARYKVHKHKKIGAEYIRYID